MRSSGEEERGFKEEEHNDSTIPFRNRQDDSFSSSSSSSKHTEQQQAELLKKLDSIKGHVLRAKPNVSDHHPPVGFHGFYNNPYPYQPYIDPYGFPMHSRPPPNWHPGLYPNHILPYPQGGQFVDIGPDLFDPQFPPRYPDIPFSPVSHNAQKFGPLSPHGGAVQSHHTRWPSDIDSDMGGAFTRDYLENAVSDTESRRCHPLAGGAPFIACHNCFELLYLPNKKLIAQGKHPKLKCGACSEIISFTIADKNLVFTSDVLAQTTNRVSVEIKGRSSTTTVVDALSLKDEKPRLHQDSNTVQVVSPSDHSYDDERSSISSEPQKQVAMSVRRRVKDVKGPPPPPPENSNLLQLFEYSNVNRAALTYGMAQLGYNKQDSYMKQESVVTETDVSYNNNTEVSEDSRISSKIRKEERRPRNRKESSENIFSEEDNEQLEVWVNGYLIPEELVISAEKQAGPVQAGKYWYDYRAGFWGVMGNPCLGIIPPFIEEFSRPMPDNCGAGNTSVFVNGRELHERDLELLAVRGLPREKNRCYIVDISGRILDGDSGEELKSLGKLAPTVDKVKHGFGMRVPRSLASSSA